MFNVSDGLFLTTNIGGLLNLADMIVCGQDAGESNRRVRLRISPQPCWCVFLLVAIL